MSKTILVLIATIFAYTAPADPLPAQTGPAQVNLTLTTQPEGSSVIRSRTNHTKTATNEISITKTTLKKSSFNGDDLVQLLANSFNTNFPAGSQIGIGPEHGLCVLDSSGTSMIFQPTDIIMSNAFKTVFLTSGITTEVTPLDGSPGSDIQTGFMVTTAILQMNYDDTALTTADGTHTKFIFQGLYTQRNSGKKPQSNVQTTIEFAGTGGGILRDVPAILTGSITAKALTPAASP